MDCGPGTDRVIADAGDVVAADCETVERAGGAPAAGKPGGPGATPAGASGATPRLTITAARLRTVLRSGLTVRLAGLRPGTVTVKVRVGTRVVASGRAKVAASGTATVRVRFTRAARRTPAKRKAVRLTVRAGSVSRSITVKR